ncbi:YitT family protein [Haloimpatiens sp. FM7330]|uniref:YitT family protein n=1 Tax=Haloimpatiens sp. FM7330 TaxID=3298610 RepID=UPI0036446825
MSAYLQMSKSEIMKRCIMIILGSVITAIGINLFIIPCNLLSGGLSGFCLILQYLTGIPVGYSTLLLNIPLFLLSVLKIDKKFTTFTLVGTLAFSGALIGTQFLTKVLVPVVPANELLYCIYGGILNGIGLGIVFTNYGSTGGMDIISMYIKKKYNMDIGSSAFVINFIIVAIGSILFNFKVGLYTLIVMYLASFCMDKVIKGFNRQKMLLIITDKQQEVSHYVMNELKRGITVLYGEGAYTKDKRNVMYCIVSLGQLPKVKQIIKSIDNNAFISIVDTAEVQGKGFESPLA